MSGIAHIGSFSLRIQRLSQWLMIRPSEGKALGYLCLLALANGLGMAFGRGSSDALFFKRFGVEYLPHMFFLTSILLVLFSTIYVEFTDRVRPARMLLAMLLILAIFLSASWAFMATGRNTAPFAIYFLGVSVASEMFIVHFNLYISQFFDFNQAKRLTPLIDAAARLGRVLGGLLLVLVAKKLPTEASALLWVGVIVCSMSMIGLYHRGERRRPQLPMIRKRIPFSDVREGLRFARHSPLLQLTGAGVFLLIILISIQDYVASTIITHHYTNDQELAAFFGWFFAFTNALVLLLQIGMTSRLLRRFGLKVVNLIFPCSTALSFGLLSISASFIPALIGRFNYMGMMPAFRASVFNLFYSALPSYIQGRARAMVIGLILPLGLGSAGLLLLWVPKDMVGQPLAFAGLLLSLLYLYVKIRKNQAYSETLLSLIQRQVFSDKQPAVEGVGRFSAEVAQRIADLVLNSSNVEAARAYASLLIEHAPEVAAALLQQRLNQLSPTIIEYLMQQLAASALPQWREAVHAALQHQNARVRIAAAALVEAQGEETLLPPLLQNWLQENNPRLQAQAARIMLKHANLRAADAAETALVCLLQGEPGAQICALNAVAELGDPARHKQASTLLNATANRVRAAAVRCCAAISDNEAERFDILCSAVKDENAAVRIAAAQTLGRMTDTETRLALLQALLCDAEFAVRRAAQLAAPNCMPQTAAAYASALTTYYDQFFLQTLLCKYLAQSGLSEKSELLDGVAQTHLSAAYDKKALMQQLQNDHDTGKQFLCLVLAEDSQQHIDLVLEILSLSDTSGVMASVQAALHSENRRLRAQALESLRNVASSKFLLDLCAFIESEIDDEALPQRWPQLPISGPEALQWCARHGSAWLRQCAMALLSKIPVNAERKKS